VAAIAYVNGVYGPVGDAVISIEDRGLQFGDGIYEVVYVSNGRLVDPDLHLARLFRSLTEIELSLAQTPAALMVVIKEVLRRNRVNTGLVYIQVTRGAARRDHPFPPACTKPGLVVTARHRPPPPQDADDWAVNAICLPDERWGRCDIKSTNLLPNVLARQKARLAGAYEAIFYDRDENVTEGAASSVWMVDAQGVLITRQLDRHILPGCTRAALIHELEQRQISLREAPFSLAALRAAREIFITSATSFVKPVIKLDGAPVGNGAAGPVTKLLLQHYLAHITEPDASTGA
jgi:D-alanine transaminase